MAAVLLSLFFCTDAVLVLRQGYPLLEAQDRIIATVLFAGAWALISCRRRLIIKEVFGLTIISLFFCVPSMVLDFTEFELLSKKPAISVHSARIICFIGVLIDCIIRLVASQRRVKLEEESASLLPYSDGNSNENGNGAEATSPSDDNSEDSDEGYDSDDPYRQKESKEKNKKSDKSNNSWMDYIAEFKPLRQYVIPKRI